MADAEALPLKKGLAALQTALPFVVGCGSGMVATACVQPIDTIKVRMQLVDRSLLRVTTWSIARDMMAEGGVLKLYQGLSAAILRSLVYGTMRLGLFSTFEKELARRARERGTTLSFGERSLAGVGAGALAALVGNPTEVILIRMQADGLKPLSQQARYSSAFDALRRIASGEGVLALWKGAGPTLIRAMSINFGQLTSFSEAKNQLQEHTSLSPPVRTALAAGIAGCLGALISQPFDFVKTRLQNQAKPFAAVGPGSGELLYKGTFDCLLKVVRKEGFSRLYRDILPYFMRIGPHSIIALFLTDTIIRRIETRSLST
ncbi:mitochondrial dicarboxylate carrier [Microdochium trichocladiopsis]|uniref:Mitochondrial dicarboxylate carrier n=1 Tax=Microdochium trichocladiopsis TaxID=1682393 RepID=A0A9P8Y400_9PEZI|nr:mitochondrial dicarboxylate carrier [Microdochium trichocladiopsis]KAH7028940.1 mitochondrial dicarboxylate carrier [Microdochium trichocladiopsis]